MLVVAGAGAPTNSTPPSSFHNVKLEQRLSAARSKGQFANDILFQSWNYQARAEESSWRTWNGGMSTMRAEWE